MNIVLTEIGKTSEVNMDNKIETNINLKTEINDIEKNINSNQIILNKEIKNTSKSNPKKAKENKRQKTKNYL